MSSTSPSGSVDPMCTDGRYADARLGADAGDLPAEKISGGVTSAAVISDGLILLVTVAEAIARALEPE